MKATSIQETPATEINKKHLPPAKRTILMPRTVAKNARKRVSDGDYSLWSVIDGARVITPSAWLKTLFLAVRICRLIRCLSACRSSQFCQKLYLLLYSCRFQRLTPHNFEYIQTVFNLFQSRFHRLQIPL